MCDGRVKKGAGGRRGRAGGIGRIEKNLIDHIRACLYPDWNNPLERRKKLMMPERNCKLRR